MKNRYKCQIDLIEMEFNMDGKGYYQHYSDYNPDSKWQTLMTCQPVPVIKHDHGKYILHFTSMTGEFKKEFTLLGDTLIIKEDNDKEKRYVKYKDKKHYVIMPVFYRWLNR